MRGAKLIKWREKGGKGAGEEGRLGRAPRQSRD